MRTSLKIFGNEQIISNESNRHGILAAIKAHDLVLQKLSKYLRAGKVGCVFPMVVVDILPHAEFGPNTIRKMYLNLIAVNFGLIVA